MEENISADEVTRSIVVHHVPKDATRDVITIHFQKRKYGGGDVASVRFPYCSPTTAIVTFDEEATVDSVISVDHKINIEDVCVQRLKQEVFLRVTVALFPWVFTRFGSFCDTVRALKNYDSRLEIFPSEENNKIVVTSTWDRIDELHSWIKRQLDISQNEGNLLQNSPPNIDSSECPLPDDGVDFENEEDDDASVDQRPPVSSKIAARFDGLPSSSNASNDHHGFKDVHGSGIPSNSSIRIDDEASPHAASHNATVSSLNDVGDNTASHRTSYSECETLNDCSAINATVQEQIVDIQTLNPPNESDTKGESTTGMHYRSSDQNQSNHKNESIEKDLNKKADNSDRGINSNVIHDTTNETQSSSSSNDHAMAHLNDPHGMKLISHDLGHFPSNSRFEAITKREPTDGPIAESVLGTREVDREHGKIDGEEEHISSSTVPSYNCKDTGDMKVGNSTTEMGSVETDNMTLADQSQVNDQPEDGTSHPYADVDKELSTMNDNDLSNQTEETREANTNTNLRSDGHKTKSHKMNFVKEDSSTKSTMTDIPNTDSEIKANQSTVIGDQMGEISVNRRAYHAVLKLYFNTFNDLEIKNNVLVRYKQIDNEHFHILVRGKNMANIKRVQHKISTLFSDFESYGLEETDILLPDYIKPGLEKEIRDYCNNAIGYGVRTAITNGMIRIEGLKNRANKFQREIIDKFNLQDTLENASGVKTDGTVSGSGIASSVTVVTEEGLHIRIYKDDITKISVNVLVNVSNEHMDCTKTNIAKAAGPSFTTEFDAFVNTKGKLKVGEVNVCSRVNMATIRNIYNTVGPMWSEDTKDVNKVWTETLFNCLQKGHVNGISSIGIPLDSSGLFRGPNNCWAECICNAVQTFSSDKKGKTSIKTIHLVSDERDTNEMIKQVFKQRFVRGESNSMIKYPPDSGMCSDDIKDHSHSVCGSSAPNVIYPGKPHAELYPKQQEGASFEDINNDNHHDGDSDGPNVRREPNSTIPEGEHTKHKGENEGEPCYQSQKVEQTSENKPLYTDQILVSRKLYQQMSSYNYQIIKKMNRDNTTTQVFGKREDDNCVLIFSGKRKDNVQKVMEDITKLYQDVAFSKPLEINIPLPQSITPTKERAIKQWCSDKSGHGVLADVIKYGIKLEGLPKRVKQLKKDIYDKFKLSITPRNRFEEDVQVNPSNSPNKVHITTNEGLKILIYKDDITKVTVDAIVNAANERLDHGGGVAAAIARAAGSSFTRECDAYVRQYGRLRTGEVNVCGSGKLSTVRNIFNAVGPMSGKDKKSFEMKLMETFVNCLNRAHANAVKTIAIPLISSGIFGGDKRQCAECLCSAVQSFSFEKKAKTSLKEVHLVNIDREATEMLTKVFKQRFGSDVSNAMSRHEPEGGISSSRTIDQRYTGNRKTTADRHLTNEGQRHEFTSAAADVSNMNKKIVYPTESFADAQSRKSNKKWTSDGSGMDGAFSAKPYYETAKEDEGGGSKRDSVAGGTGESAEEKSCPICYEDTRVLTRLPCGHQFCQPCLDRWDKAKCSICGHVFGVITGTMPKGDMRFETNRSISLPGHEGCGTITIYYTFLNGIQGNEHPTPGNRYHGTYRTAYLPDSAEGRKVLRLLRKAFDARVTFTVGVSNTTGRADAVTWNDIHHKTAMTGGPQNFGYPDRDYLRRVQEELAAHGITE